MILRKMKPRRWVQHGRGEKLNGVKLIVGEQEVGYVFPSEDGHKWVGFLNALYHEREYPNLKAATKDIEERWDEFVDRISEQLRVG